MSSGFSFSSDGASANISVSLNYVDLASEATTIVRRPIAVPASLANAAAATPQSNNIGKDGFLGIFRWLSPRQLLQCALVCKQCKAVLGWGFC